ncbi:MAG: folylpolyglutamate synthase/dihydrofolate synthase family protein [Candidatus Burarchaeum sp.]|nr:folylpolyglutamate synthase/dihydrofolate synthase family protein [Candidatus Burarchaeum sp.]MDO8340337.1 folylpolyglutamate synthase/dihydrofolate synthase family protein [Candidatus Burarchaeum sp.]
MKYRQAIAALYKLSLFGSVLGLERIKELEQKLGWPERSFKCILVAGSNGKGSTATMIARSLEEAGYRTGLYLSPHVDDFRERISINGKKIGGREVAEEYSRVAAVARKMKPQATFFEILTAMALDYFARRKVEWAVLEVGLGGRLDAANIVEPELSVITRVDLEHTDKLGRTLAEIAREKAGIMRNGKFVITGAEGEGLSALKRLASEKKAKLVVARGRYEGKLAMMGEHQKKNAAVAKKALQMLGVPKNAITRGLAHTILPARLEVMGRKPLVIHDGAHNPAAMKQLAEEIRRMKLAKSKLILVFGAMKDKDFDAMLHEIAPLASEVIVNQARLERAARAGELAQAARKYNKRVRVVKDVRESARKARKLAGKNGAVLATGSIYMLSELRGKNRLRVTM